MKFKTLAIGLMVISLLGAANSGIYAQKKVTKKTTATTNAATAPKPSALNCESLTDKFYIAWTNLDNSNGILTYSEIEIEKYNFSWWASNKDQFIGTWGISGNKLNLKSTSSTPVSLNLESNNDGKSFTGTFVNSAKNYKGASYLYQVILRSAPPTAQEIEDFFKDGDVIGYLEFFMNKNKLEIGVPVSVSFTFDENNNRSGYMKLQSTAAAFPEFGVAKIPFIIGEKDLTTIDKEDKKYSRTYESMESYDLMLKVGNLNVPSLGKGELYLYLIPNPDK